MFMRKTLLVRACALAVGLSFLSTGVAVAGPSDCTEWARGGQTGNLYHLVGQSEVTETQTFTVEGGGCGFSAGTEVTRSETYNVGTYEDSAGNRVDVNCSTGEVI